MSGVGIVGRLNRTKPACATFTVRYVFGQGYRVFDPDGNPVGEIMAEEGQAIGYAKGMQTRADRAAKRVTRACLCCGTAFASEGIHNRMCLICRGRSDSDLAPAQIGRLSGLGRSA